MAGPVINFLKKTYKILIVLVTAIIFFLGYNIYLVDRSLINLRVTLDKLSDAKTVDEAKRLASMLDYSLLAEVASADARPINLASIEMAKEILTRPEDASQLEEAKFALKEVIKQKEKDRPAILVALDKINQMFALATPKASKTNLSERADYLKEKIKTIKDENKLQQSYYELANIYTQLSEFEKAKQAYRKSIDIKPESGLAQKSHFNLAWNEKYQGNLGAAITEFENLAQTTNEEKLKILSKFQLAETYRKKGDYEKAITFYQEIARESQDKDLAQLSELKTGYTYLYDLKDYDKAKDVFEKSKTQFVDTSMAVRIDKAAIPSIVAQYRREGFKLLKDGYELSLPEKHKESHKYFDKALEIDPQDGVSLIGKALAYLWLKDPDRALGYGKKAVKLLPTNEVASVNLGYIYIELGLIGEAIIEYKRFTSANPFSAYGYYNLGYAYALQNRLDEAISAFRKASKIDPRFVAALNNQGWCLWKVGKYAEAEEVIKMALNIQPDFIDALFNLGLIYKHVGRYDEAKKRFERLLQINPNHLEAKLHLEEIEKFSETKNSESKK